MYRDAFLCLRHPLASMERYSLGLCHPHRTALHMPSRRESSDGCSSDALARSLDRMKAWPESWALQGEDIAFGNELVAVFEAFLVELYMDGLSARTNNRHKGNLWILGGELARARLNGSLPRTDSALRALASRVSEDGGFFLPRVPEEEQRSYDSTCRKLSRFLPDFHDEQRAM